MASTRLVAVRSALVAGVAGLDEFADVGVMYAWKPTQSRSVAFTSEARFTHAPASLRAGRNFRDEVGTFKFTILLELPGGSLEAAADAALACGLAFEEYVADNKTGLGVAGVYALLVDGEGALTEMANDRASLAELEYPIRYNARLT